MALENKNYSGAKPPVDEYDVNADGKPLTDGSAVKFIPQDNSVADKNGDAKVDIGSLPSQAPFAGMGKEELLKYANEPFWIRLRWFLFILFWLAWVAMFAGAIALIILAPRCPPIPTPQWWQKSPIYKIEPRSFKDSNSDGTGDLKGIESKLDHLVKLGVKSVLLGPIYSSSDTLGDIMSYTDVDTKLGTLEDFKSLITEAHKKDIRIILDFIPNHTSNRHIWFINEEKKKDYYVWAKENKNNWKTKANASAWTSENNKYYYHKFNESQPDLNWHNQDLRNEMNQVLKFWLGLGVDGFNMKDAQYLLENLEQNNETFPGEFTEHHPDTFLLIQEWKSIMENYTERVLLIDVVGKIDQMVRYYGNSIMENGTRGGDLVINYQLMHLNEGITGYQLSEVVNNTIQHVHFTEWPSWIISDTTQGHVATRFQKSNLVDCFNALLLTLKGTPITYYGDEIGLVDNPSSGIFEAPFTPMSWNSEENAGFSNSSNVWLSPSADFKTTNVMAQETGPSHLKFYKELVKLRSDPSIAYGNMSIKLVNEQIFSFLREASGNNPKFLTILNLKNETYRITNEDVEKSGLPGNGRLFQAGSTTPSLKRSTTITTIVNYDVPPYAALIFKI